MNILSNKTASKKHKTNNITIYIIVLVLLLPAFFLLRPKSAKKTIEIQPGMNASEIAHVLVKKEIIKNPEIFLFVLKLSGRSKDLKAGIFKISPGTNYFSIIKKLIKVSEVYAKVTIPEGYTAEQIAQRLYENNIIDDGKKFVELIEEMKLRGFLFPETYNFLSKQKTDKILKTMTVQFYKVVTKDYIERAKELGYTLNEIVTLASLIEKEAKVSSERPVISAIFHKRLKKRMYLESCASVLFALGEHKKKLRYKDLEIESPYNTYRNFGLPPTPICNPGRESLHAAIYPADTDYLYFFARGAGSHIFSKTYKEHLRLQREYKRKK